ncbi:hypothetical protein Poly41_54050 [Novipirellula artificiosorum]|uniref:Uncharacterized protein n=1 Tax=Novipirellula artificiosorum TaxID=2528016 RepID=A0A5C6DCS8_9BACT|nr:hypothetical protein Poly41_54050 [Novipirellula artificiosorum]
MLVSAAKSSILGGLCDDGVRLLYKIWPTVLSTSTERLFGYNQEILPRPSQILPTPDGHSSFQ